jgi:hypothetical protein
LGYEWGYLYVAIAPHTGELCAKYYAHFDNDCFKDFAQEMKRFFDSPLLCLADSATPHQQKNCPEQVIYVPPPRLNSILSNVFSKTSENTSKGDVLTTHNKFNMPSISISTYINVIRKQSSVSPMAINTQV